MNSLREGGTVRIRTSVFMEWPVLEEPPGRSREEIRQDTRALWNFRRDGLWRRDGLCGRR
jgi:hypothetical protein